MKKLAIKSKNFILILSLLAVISIAGCVGGGGGGQTTFTGGADALSVDLITEVNTVESLEPFLITMRADNKGVFDAKDVSVRLQGYDGITYQSGTKSLSTLETLNPNLLEYEKPEQGLAGGTGSYTWNVRAPYLSKELPDREVTLSGEIFYDYKSIASQSVVVATREHESTAAARGDVIAASSLLNTLNGPISLEVQAPTPHVTVSGTESNFRITVSAFNDGSGNLFNKQLGGGTYEALNTISLTIPPGLMPTSNCDFISQGTSLLESDRYNFKTYTIDLSNNPDKLRLIEGGLTRDYSCVLNVKAKDVPGENAYTLDTESTYTYLQSVSKKIVIRGSEAELVQLQIVKPTTFVPDTFSSSSSSETLEFKVFERGVEKTTGVFAQDLTLKIDGNTVTLSSLNYDSTKKVWKLTYDPSAASLSTGLYDVSLTYNVQNNDYSGFQNDAVSIT